MAAASKYFIKGSYFWYEDLVAVMKLSYFSLISDHLLSLLIITSWHFITYLWCSCSSSSLHSRQKFFNSVHPSLQHRYNILSLSHSHITAPIFENHSCLCNCVTVVIPSLLCLVSYTLSFFCLCYTFSVVLCILNNLFYYNL